MPASVHLRGEQLAMFMPARQLMKRVGASLDPAGNESMGDMWKRKLSESSLPAGTQYPNPYKGQFLNANQGSTTTLGTGVLDSMKKRGYQGESIRVHHLTDPDGTPDQKNLMILDGHHRLAAAAHLNLEVPVDHNDRASEEQEFYRKNPGAPRPSKDSAV